MPNCWVSRSSIGATTRTDGPGPLVVHFHVSSTPRGWSILTGEGPFSRRRGLQLLCIHTRFPYTTRFRSFPTWKMTEIRLRKIAERRALSLEQAGVCNELRNAELLGIKIIHRRHDQD